MICETTCSAGRKSEPMHPLKWDHWDCSWVGCQGFFSHSTRAVVQLFAVFAVIQGVTRVGYFFMHVQIARKVNIIPPDHQHVSVQRSMHNCAKVQLQSRWHGCRLLVVSCLPRRQNTYDGVLVLIHNFGCESGSDTGRGPHLPAGLRVLWGLMEAALLWPWPG